MATNGEVFAITLPEDVHIEFDDHFMEDDFNMIIRFKNVSEFNKWRLGECKHFDSDQYCQIKEYELYAEKLKSIILHLTMMHDDAIKKLKEITSRMESAQYGIEEIWKKVKKKE